MAGRQDQLDCGTMGGLLDFAPVGLSQAPGRLDARKQPFALSRYKAGHELIGGCGIGLPQHYGRGEIGRHDSAGDGMLDLQGRVISAALQRGPKIRGHRGAGGRGCSCHDEGSREDPRHLVDPIRHGGHEKTKSCRRGLVHPQNKPSRPGSGLAPAG